jgi:hypothetical protein
MRRQTRSGESPIPQASQAVGGQRHHVAHFGRDRRRLLDPSCPKGAPDLPHGRLDDALRVGRGLEPGQLVSLADGRDARVGASALI